MKHTSPRSIRKSNEVRARRRTPAVRPAGEQAIGSRLYAQIRAAIAELKR